MLPPLFNYFLIFCAIILFSFAHIFATLALLARTSGILTNKPYIAHSIEKIVALIGLLCLSLFVPILAFLTETIFSSNNIIFLCAISQIFTFFSIFLVYKIRYKLIDYFSKCGTAYQTERHIFSACVTAFKLTICTSIEPIRRFNFRIGCVGLVANIFLAAGFFFGFYLAGVHADHRLTISQTSIFINGIGTLITSLYGDSALARNLESKDAHFSWCETLSSYLLGRLCSHAVLASVSFVIFMI